MGPGAGARSRGTRPAAAPLRGPTRGDAPVPGGTPSRALKPFLSGTHASAQKQPPRGGPGHRGPGLRGDRNDAAVRAARGEARGDSRWRPRHTPERLERQAGSPAGAFAVVVGTARAGRPGLACSSDGSRVLTRQGQRSRVLDCASFAACLQTVRDSRREGRGLSLPPESGRWQRLASEEQSAAEATCSIRGLRRVGSPRASCLEPGAAGCRPHRGLQALAQPRPPGVAAECPGQRHRLRSHPTAPSGRSPDECAKTPSDGSPPVTPSCQAVPAKALEKVRPGRAGHSVVCERGRVAAAATVCSGSRRSPRESVQGSGRWPQDAARHGTSGWACVLLPLEGRTTLWSRGWPGELSMSG